MYLLSTSGVLKSLPFELLVDKLRDVRGAYIREDHQIAPIHVPHPYFGYLYNPGKRLTQYSYHMTFESNSDGFIDDDFPSEKIEGECVYGLLGGSAALSLGVKHKEDRISNQLQALLNQHNQNDKCRHYRVLNMGLGGGLQIQATFIYLYYWRLLDGVIFYIGNNECSNGTKFAEASPVQFPIPEIYATFVSVLTSDSMVKLRSHVVDSFDGPLTRIALKAPIFFRSNTMRVAYTIKFDNLEKFKRKLDEEAGKKMANLPRFTRKMSLPNFDSNKFLYEDVALQKKIMRHILPFTYTDPLIQANAVAKAKNSPFLLVIQPMLGATDKVLNEEEKAIKPFPLYQRTCKEIFKEEARKLNARGIVTHDLNLKNLFKEVGTQIFNDPSHVNEEGNKIVASHLHQLISQWHGESKDMQDAKRISSPILTHE